MAVHVESITQWNTLLRESTQKPLLVKCGATWCGPCKVLAPLVDQMAGEFEDKVLFLSVDIEELPEVADKFNVSSVPAMFIIWEGEIVKSTVGASKMVIDEVRSKLNALIN
jgi:thioredoxin 1